MAKNRGGSSEGGANMKTVLSWILGVATIALTLLIMLILFGNLSGNVGFGNNGITISVANESSYTPPVHANVSGYTLSGFNTSWSSITITELWNSSDDVAGNGEWNTTVPVANGSVSSLGILTNGTDAVYDNVSVSYTYSHSFESPELARSNAFIANYTKGIANTGEQFPVVGTIIGVALLLLILIGILVFAMVNLAKVNKGSLSGSFGQ